MVSGDLPAQPPQGTTLTLYSHLRVVYILGFLEALFGLAIAVLESAAIGLFFDKRTSFDIEVGGILVGLLVFVTGFFDFWAGRDNVTPQLRRKLFVVGIVLSLVSLIAVGIMLVLSILRTHKLYTDAKETEGREGSDAFKQVPYIQSLEGMRHAAQLRAIAGATHALCILPLMGTLYLDAVNVGKNKNNTQVETVYSRVPKEQVRLTNNGTEM